MTRVLAGDLGGPNAGLAIVSTDGGPRRWVTREDFHSRDHDSLEELVRSFLSRTNHPVAKATFGVAGPVVAGQASITNLPWGIDPARLQAPCGLSPVPLVNDVHALAHNPPGLEAGDPQPPHSPGPARDRGHAA